MGCPTQELTITTQQVTALRDHLLQEDGLERVAYVYCSQSGDDRLLAEQVVPVTDGQLLTQDRTRCRPTLDTERTLLQDCQDRGMHPLIVHSHPFDTSAIPEFSDHDDDLMDGLQTMITGLWPDTMAMFAVLNTDGISTAIYNPVTDQREPLPATVIGNRRLDTPLAIPPDATPSKTATSVNTARYDRNIRAITEDGQQALAGTHIGLVGAGGLGSIMAEEFARYGVQTLTIIDPDIVEESNLPRLFGAYDHHVGRPKVAAVREHLWRVNPDIDITTIQDTAQNAADALKQVDLIVASVDQVSARMWLNQFAVRYLIPYVDAGVIIKTTETADKTSDTTDTSSKATTDDATGAPSASTGCVASMEGYIQFIAPGANACFDCLDRGDPEQARIERLSPDELEEERDRGYIEDTDLSPEPAVVPLNGIVASKTVQLIAKHITGYARPADYLRFEGVENTLTALTTHPSDRCATCGDTGILGRGDRSPTPADLENASADLDLEIGTEPESETETEPESEVETEAEQETETRTAISTVVDRLTAFFDQSHN